MIIPGFTAEASLAVTSDSYVLRSKALQGIGGVLPQATICTIDEDASAAAGKTVFSCLLIHDGVVIPVPVVRHLF